MQQLTFVEAGTVEWRDVPAPELTDPGGALVRPLAVSRCDLDLPMVAAGLFPGPFGVGHEIAAEVVEVGRRGDRRRAGRPRPRPLPGLLRRLRRLRGRPLRRLPRVPRPGRRRLRLRRGGRRPRRRRRRPARGPRRRPPPRPGPGRHRPGGPLHPGRQRLRRLPHGRRAAGGDARGGGAGGRRRRGVGRALLGRGGARARRRAGPLRRPRPGNCEAAERLGAEATQHEGPWPRPSSGPW